MGTGGGCGGLEAAVEAAKSAGQHERHDENSSAEREHVAGIAQAEAADAADEHVGDGEVEKAPEDIDGGGR